ncbi:MULTISPECIES: hypothetical protein [Clostridium]|nr:hypothetical protein [[Clostridium] innocuum]MCC2845914.1 hypothetical protein [[Clostridium] innocuum]MCC2850107.1 hypothetical protein [[Clostridium] innocuum]MCC2854182.1 hypothetical protein [[Clostridium] innocuum]MCQ5278834.1 hypothetical protein [Clostridium sp. DFI.1.208]
MAYVWKIEQFAEMLLGVTGVALGLSFMMKSGLGQTALTAFLQCVSLISGMKSGTLLMCFYLLCVLLQLLIQQKEFDKLQVLQLPVCWMQGIIINLTCYDIAFLADIRPASYPMQWVFLAVGILLVSFGVALTMAADLVKQPFEQLITVISKKYQKPFNFLRCSADAVFVSCSLLLIVVYSLDFTMLREGTWISMLVLGNTMAASFPLMQKCSICYRHKHENTEVSL